ncbi:MAG: CehA/McbA family metallohydrolase [Thermoleophilia bacterium]|nr:CehA/McbA family metallohydrolase [Thermoleophilia bacterium]
MSILVAVLIGCFAVPAVASAADCNLPDTPVTTGHTIDEALDGTEMETKGNFKPTLNGKFMQIPFTVLANTTGLRIRYCYDNKGPDGLTGFPNDNDNTTLDLGVYGPNAADPGNFTMAQRRGWSGSAVKIIGIGENGPTSKAVYGTSNTDRKSYTPGNTTRAYKPGAILAGQWAIELGGGYIDAALAAGVDWKVGVTTTTDPAWSDGNFVPNPYTPYTANPAAGWYTGDFHVHGENEPGNALMKDTFDLGFGAGGLDFLTLVDHNNDVALQTQLGKYDTEYPGKLIIPGTEMTTYDGHFNSQNSTNVFTDFRMSTIYKFTGLIGDLTDVSEANLTQVRGAEDPSSRFAQIRAAGGMAQINHPAIFKNSPAACRGCAWNYSDARTDFSKVSSIEIQTGTAGIPYSGPTAMNPFTNDTLAYYEHALATGNHIAAVGSSDDHKAGGATGPFDSPVGYAATAVYANQLSQTGITNAVNAGHTYVKFYGAAGPDVEMTGTGTSPGDGSAIPGDSLTSDELKFSINVKNAGPSAVDPGPYTLEILKNGISVDSTTVVGDDFTYGDFSTSASGRYSFKLSRKVGVNPLIVAYSTPIWFTYQAATPTCETDESLCPKPSNKFSFKGVKLNKKKGTARIKVKFPSIGRATLTGRGVKKASVKIKKKNSIVGLNVKPKAKLLKKLKKKGSAKVKVKVKFTPTGGKALTKSKTIKLKLKKSRKR